MLCVCVWPVFRAMDYLTKVTVVYFLRVRRGERRNTSHVTPTPEEEYVATRACERNRSGERSVQNIVGTRSVFLSKGWSDRSVSLRYRSHHEPRACRNPPRIHLCLQQLTKPSAYTLKIVRCEGEMEFVKYFQKQTDRSYNSCQKNR